MKISEFNNSIYGDLEMVKNDTLSFNFQLQGLEGQQPFNILFTCKNNPDDEEYIFQRQIGDGISLLSYDAETDIATYTLRIAPDNTETMSCGRYFYDLEVTVNSDVFTLMRGRLELLWEASSGSAPAPTPAYEDGDNILY